MAFKTRYYFKLPILIAFIALGGCGQKKKSNSSPTIVGGPVRQAFDAAAGEQRVPARLMMAVAYLESRFNADSGYGVYFTDSKGEKSVSRGTALDETTFGLSQASLGLEDSTSADIKEQIKAYAQLIRARLDEQKIVLPANPSLVDDKFQWLWQIAQVHRSAGAGRRNIPVLFVKEVINVLNDGFLWQSADGQEIIDFPKENPPLRIEDFPSEGQKLLTLDMSYSEIPRARYFPLALFNKRPLTNNPRRVEIVHCPLTLSACLELSGSEVKPEKTALSAHYVIPDRFDYNGIESALQIGRHNEVVSITGADGLPRQVTDAIVIMMVGSSGKIINSVRQQVNPMWFNDQQLREMGKIANDFCSYLEAQGTTLASSCLNSSDKKSGVRFQWQQSGQAYHMGDIPDFDLKLFQSYIENPNGLLGETSLKLDRARPVYKPGEAINLSLLFQISAKSYEVEKLMRCPDGRLSWVTVESAEVRSQTSQHTTLRIWDGGPDGDGKHYVRSKVYATTSNEDLIGWQMSSVLISTPEKELQYAPPRYCMQ